MEQAYQYIHDLKEKMPEIPENSIISQTLYKDEKIEVTLFGFDAGQELSEHTSAYPAVVQAIEGEAALTLAAYQFVMKADTWAFMPSYLPHSLKAHTRFILLLTLFKSV